MKYLFALFLMICLTASKSFGQTNPNNIPKPPTAKLKIYEPFFGRYNMTSEYGRLKFNGTIEIKPVIKGWYVEQTILVKSEDNKIDREFRMMITYDSAQSKYRVWRFETLPVIPFETTLRTEGSDIILEMQVPPMKEGGPQEIIYNRYSMVSKDQMKILSEVRSLDGKVIEQVGVSSATRIQQKP
jgi:hypothetical protein